MGKAFLHVTNYHLMISKTRFRLKWTIVQIAWFSYIKLIIINTESLTSKCYRNCWIDFIHFYSKWDWSFFPRTELEKMVNSEAKHWYSCTTSPFRFLFDWLKLCLSGAIMAWIHNSTSNDIMTRQKSMQYVKYRNCQQQIFVFTAMIVHAWSRLRKRWKFSSLGKHVDIP
jgi:hypothetical protein